MERPKSWILSHPPHWRGETLFHEQFGYHEMLVQLYSLVQSLKNDRCTKDGPGTP